MDKKVSLKALTTSAMLTAMSVIIGIFCKSFLNFGGGLFRITFENVPIIIAGIVFGPFIGGLVGCASDLISYLLSAQVYPPNLIVTAGAVAVGVFSGIVPKILPNLSINKKVIISGSVAHLIGSMIIKPIGLYQFYGMAVLWRIPIYIVIAIIEIFIICSIFKHKGVKRLFGLKVRK